MMNRWTLGLVIMGLVWAPQVGEAKRRNPQEKAPQQTQGTSGRALGTGAPSSPPIDVGPIASQIVALSWRTEQPTFACVEYRTTPFTSTQRQGTFFPFSSMSLDHYTRVLSTRHDLCLTDLTPDTLYYARVWNEDAQGRERVSQDVTFRTPPKSVERFTFTKDWFGLQLSEEWKSLDEARKQNALDTLYIRTLRILAQWDDLEPRPDAFDWSLMDQQLDELTARLNGKEKSLLLVLRAGGQVGGKRMPTWAAEGVEFVKQGRQGKIEDKVIRWDPQYTCRYWQLVKAAGARYDPYPDRDTTSLVKNVAIQAISKTGEMTMSKKLLQAYRDQGYTDPEIAQNMKWLYRNSLQVYAEAFPHKGLKMNTGTIPVMDGDQELHYVILDEAARTYGKRLSLGTTGFGGIHEAFLARYRDQVVVGGQTEAPDKRSNDPVGELRTVFTKIWPHASGLGWVAMHDDALGIHPGRWKNVHQELRAFLEDVEARFATLRQ